MNYTDATCQNEFTPEQIMRMRCALMTSRPTLINSVGCEPPCSDVAVGFSPSSTSVVEGSIVTFTNNSSNATSYIWEVNMESFSSPNLTYTFQTRGYYDICLTASNSTCTNRKCIQIIVSGTLDPCTESPSICNLLINGTMYVANFPYTQKFLHNLFKSSVNRICNWSSKINSPDLFNYNNVLAAVLAGDSDYSEGIVSTNPLHFNAGQTYKIIIDYVVAAPAGTYSSAPQLQIGLAPNSSEYIDYNTDFIIGTIQSDNNINEDYYKLVDGISSINSSNFTEKSIYFTSTVDLDMHIFFINTGVVASDYVTFLIKEIEVVCSDDCIPNPDFTFNQECPKEFNGINDGQNVEYIWNFNCNGITISGQNIKIDLPPGDCEVCLTTLCASGASATVCKTVTIPEPNELCQNACEEINVSLHSCQQGENGETTFIANFSINVPAGTGACADADIVSGSNDFETKVSIFVEGGPDPDIDIINIAITIKTVDEAQIINNTIAGLINLCDSEGNVICYTLRLLGSQCTTCLGEMTAIAACNDPNPFDDRYIYKGSITIDLPFGGLTPCDPGAISSEAGYEQTLIMNNTGDQATINFSIDAPNEGNFYASSLLCFLIGADQYCYTLNFVIEPPCLPIPTECVAVWVAKDVFCQEGTEGELTYNFSMGPGMILRDAYQMCEFGLFGVLSDQDDNPISGGSVIVNNSSESNNSFIFDIDITVPCEYEGETIVLRLYFCDIWGNLVCYYFPLNLMSCEIDCNEGDVEGRTVKSEKSYSSILLYPNPTQSDAMISVSNSDSMHHIISIYDYLGKRIDYKIFSKEMRLNLTSLRSGIYFIHVLDHEGNLIGVKKLIILE